MLALITYSKRAPSYNAFTVVASEFHTLAAIVLAMKDGKEHRHRSSAIIATV
jgi:hypothetical protein